MISAHERLKIEYQSAKDERKQVSAAFPFFARARGAISFV
jgi:hypothetical protein